MKVVEHGLKTKSIRRVVQVGHVIRIALIDQGSAQRNVDFLKAPANAKNRLPGSDRGFDERSRHRISPRIAR